ncbi:hypothetical protein B0T17DRAFT_591906 [Bombardia bombarda]|uniref:Uncharacterized protein n=1 Tax=Bombardia bombarda TaxID=252184 RepID=A0AA39WMH6_9PEZI|nr:hypothetical protein B0T17DRAFT_591906 [Bombardia bombarda]
MCLIFTCGEHTFRKEVEGFEGIVCRCYNCGNYAGSVLKSNPWFTFCFIPIVPLSIHGYEDITCRICNFQQPLAHRPDVIALKHGGNGQPGVPLQDHGGAHQGAATGGKPNQGMTYG